MHFSSYKIIFLCFCLLELIISTRSGGCQILCVHMCASTSMTFANLSNILQLKFCIFVPISDFIFKDLICMHWFQNKYNTYLINCWMPSSTSPSSLLSTSVCFSDFYSLIQHDSSFLILTCTSLGQNSHFDASLVLRYHWWGVIYSGTGKVKVIYESLSLWFDLSPRFSGSTCISPGDLCSSHKWEEISSHVMCAVSALLGWRTQSAL